MRGFILAILLSSCVTETTKGDHYAAALDEYLTMKRSCELSHGVVLRTFRDEERAHPSELRLARCAK